MPTGEAARLIEHGQHQVFHADIFVFEPFGFVLRFDQQLVQSLGDVRRRRPDSCHRSHAEPVQFLFQLGFQQVGRDLGFLDQTRNQPFLLLQECQSEMLHINGLVLVAGRNVLRFLERRWARSVNRFKSINLGPLARPMPWETDLAKQATGPQRP